MSQRPGQRRWRCGFPACLAAMARAASRLAVLGLAAVLAGGCARSDGAIHRVPIDEQVQGVIAEASVLNAEMDKAVAVCMESKGLPFFAGTAREHFDILRDLLSIRFGLSVEDAETKGYGADPRSPRIEEERGYFEGLSQAEQDAYTLAHLGTEDDMVVHRSPSGAKTSFPVGGCTGAAVTKVYGSAKAYVETMGLFDEFQFMNAEILLRAQEDEALKSALSGWSACMVEEGYSFETPGDALDTAVQTRQENPRAEPGSPTRQEITIATADARCQDEVFISPIFLRATLREQRSVIAEKQPLFAAWDELMDRVASKGNPSLARDSKE